MEVTKCDICGYVSKKPHEAWATIALRKSFTRSFDVCPICLERLRDTEPSQDANGYPAYFIEAYDRLVENLVKANGHKPEEVEDGEGQESDLRQVPEADEPR